MTYSRNIKDSVRRRLYACSGNCCEMYGCTQTLIDTNDANYSQICHIEAVNEGGARYNPNLTDEYVNSFDNLLLLCPTHHTQVDSVQNTNVYTVEYLKQMKFYHENLVAEKLANEKVVEPPVFFDAYRWEKVTDKYEELYCEEIGGAKIGKYLSEIFTMNTAARSLIYLLVCSISQNGNRGTNIGYLLPYANMDYFSFVGYVGFLEQAKVIAEVSLINDPLAGYEDSEGDWVLVNTNIQYKVQNGLWQLKKRGRLLSAIESLMGRELFYRLMVTRDLNALDGLR